MFLHACLAGGHTHHKVFSYSLQDAFVAPALVECARYAAQPRALLLFSAQRPCSGSLSWLSMNGKHVNPDISCRAGICGPPFVFFMGWMLRLGRNGPRAVYPPVVGCYMHHFCRKKEHDFGTSYIASAHRYHPCQI